MSDETKLLHSVERKDGAHGVDLVFWCPACSCGHGVSTRGPGPVWTVVGRDSDAPTIIPSVKCEVVTPPPESVLVSRCHVQVISGVIRYDGDCTHGWAGRVVPMERF